MTTEEREQWAKDSDRIVNIGEMMDLKCGQAEAMVHDNWVGWYLQKAFELGLSQELDPNWDELKAALERPKEYIATTPPAMRCPCKKGVLLVKAGQLWGVCDAKPALIRKERELKEVAQEEWVLKRQRLDIEERFERAKVGAQGLRRRGETRTRHTSPPSSCSVSKQPWQRNSRPDTMDKFHTLYFLSFCFLQTHTHTHTSPH